MTDPIAGMAEPLIDTVVVVECSLCGKRLPGFPSHSRKGGWYVRAHRRLGETSLCPGRVRTDHQPVK